MAIIETAFIQIFFDEEAGTFDISDKERALKIVSHAYASVHVISPEGAIQIFSTCDNTQREYKVTPIADRFGKGNTLVIILSYRTGFIFTFTIIVYEKYPSILFKSSLQCSQNGYKIVTFQPFILSEAAGGAIHLGSICDIRMFRQDWQSWSPVEVISLTKQVKRPWMKLPRRIMYSTEEQFNKGDYLSENIAILKNIKTQQFMLLGFVSMRDQITQIGLQVSLQRDKIMKIFARSIVGGIALHPNIKVSSEPLLLIINGMSAVESLDAYATITQQEMQAISWDNVPIGWCSWYYYYWHRVTQDVILQHAHLLATRQDLPLDYVQLDDGYLPIKWTNVKIGDWYATNDRFPLGLKHVADQITAEGLKPGLWIAPFLISKSSQLFKDHPDWVIKDRNGDPMEAEINPEWGIFNKFYGLDCTHPEAQDWLRSLFKTIVKNWGYKFIKLDFMFAAAIDGIFYDKSLTRIQAYRMGLKIIRKAVGDDVFILACGAPLGPSIGLVNGMRIGGDTYYAFDQPFLYWFLNKFFFAGLEGVPSMKEALKAVVLRSFMNHKFWINDPDCLILRKSRSSLKAHEIQFEVTLLGLCGGLLLSSDNLFELTPEDFELLKFLIPPSKDSAIPLDLFEADPPTLLKLKITPKKFFSPYYLFGLFNWTKKAHEITISIDQFQLNPAATYHIFDFWSREYFQLHGTQAITRDLKKHSAKLLVIRPKAETPQLIASSFHFRQGIKEVTNFEFDSQTNILSIEITKPGSNQGCLYLYIPPAYHKIELLNEHPSSLEQTKDGLILIHTAFENTIQILLKLEK
ncbi:MAG: alpha-galactosidase [Candidatus Helarchaeota archaeon]